MYIARDGICRCRRCADNRLPAHAKGDGPFPTVLMCGGLDSMQTDYYTLYERYFAPRGIAMLTLDMPSVGFSSKWKLTGIPACCTSTY